MPPASIFLRCLLCLCLVANGVASAAAGVRIMGMSHGLPALAVQAGPAPPPMAGMAMPCHGEGMRPMAADGMTTPAPAKPPAHTGDCCDAGACYCDCMHSAPADLSVALSLPFRSWRPDTSFLPAHQYVPPMLSPLIRPPIESET